MIFSLIFSLLITLFFTYFNRDLILTLNFSLIFCLFISISQLFISFINFAENILPKIDFALINKKLHLKFYEAVDKNRKLIKENQNIRKQCIIDNLKNADLSLTICYLTKNQEKFNEIIKELNTIGITEDIILQNKGLKTIINKIESNQIEIIVQKEKEGNKISFKEVSS